MKASGALLPSGGARGEAFGLRIYCHTSDFNITLSFVMQLHNNIITHSAAGGLLFGFCVLVAPTKRKQSDDLQFNIMHCREQNKRAKCD
jgi:hypothetical protein